MTVFNFDTGTCLEHTKLPQGAGHERARFLIMCKPLEVSALRDVFGFDESTVTDCNDLDESVRYTSFEGYDFISVVHIEIAGGEPLLREINLYASPRYIVLVMPEHDSPRLRALEQKLVEAVQAARVHSNPVSRIYFLIFHNLLVDFSDTLEVLEDKMQSLSGEIVLSVSKLHFEKINSFRNTCYTVKKQLRAVSYLGEQVLLDPNKIIDKAHTGFFRNINTRFKKLYDFAESLNHFAGELLYSYDSRLTMKTNDTISKLTVLTLFFGPLTVITGIYGMNFDIMPELRLAYGYPLILAFMAVVSIVLFWVMKKKEWL